MGRSPCCAKEGLNRGAWTAMEDKILSDYIRLHGEGRWRNLPKRAGLKRCGKSCRLRWLNYLRPNIKRGNITPDEEDLIVRLHKLLGNRWSLIAGRLPGRTDNEIKNYWNTNLGKRINQNHQNQPLKDLKQSNKASIVPRPKNDSTNVVRAKAARCTKQFIDPQPPVLTNTIDATPSLPVVANDSLSEVDCHQQNSPRRNDVFSDCMMDLDSYNVDEVNLADFLDLHLLDDLCEFSNDSTVSGNDNASTAVSSEHEPFIFSKEMLEDWTNSNMVDWLTNH